MKLGALWMLIYPNEIQDSHLNLYYLLFAIFLSYAPLAYHASDGGKLDKI